MPQQARAMVQVTSKSSSMLVSQLMFMEVRTTSR